MNRINQILGFSEIALEQLEDAGEDGPMDDLNKVIRAAKELQGMIERNLPLFSGQGGGAADGGAERVMGVAMPELPAIESRFAALENMSGHILVTDDDEMNREMLTRLLKGQGFTVAAARDGREALEMMRLKDFNVVLLDVIMPEMNGYEVLRELKTDERLRHIPVIMISGVAEMDSVTHCIRHGAEDYLPKPFDSTLLAARLHSCLERKRLRDLEQETYQALLTSQRKLAAELVEAADHVRSLLPTPVDEPESSIQTDSRFIPSVDLGGDAFGYEWLDPDHFGIYLLDVCGHGVRAALLSISVMNVLRSKALAGADFLNPTSVLERLNDVFPMEQQNGMYFTIWYGVFEASTRRLVYASGGHPAATLVTEEGGGFEQQQLKTRGMVIGGFEGLPYPSAETTVPKGSRIFIYSDGVFEIEKPDGSMMESEEFIQQILQACREAPGSKLDFLLTKGKELNGGDHFEDDYSILEIRF